MVWIWGHLPAGWNLEKHPGQIVWVTLLESAQAGVAGRRRREHRSSQTPTGPQCQPSLQCLICCFLRKPGWAPSSRSFSTSLSEKEKALSQKWIFPVSLEMLSGVCALLILLYLPAGAGLRHCWGENWDALVCWDRRGWTQGGWISTCSFSPSLDVLLSRVSVIVPAHMVQLQGETQQIFPFASLSSFIQASCTGGNTSWRDLDKI